MKPSRQYHFIFSTLLLLSACSSSESTRTLSDLNGDGVGEVLSIESVFNEKDASTINIYHFADSTIPDIPSLGQCAQLSDLYELDDIDEDGRPEIALYLSSCASAYKALTVYTLKNQSWTEVGTASYNVLYPDPSIEERIKKTAQNQFQIEEVSTDPSDPTKAVSRFLNFEMTNQ